MCSHRGPLKCARPSLRSFFACIFLTHSVGRGFSKGSVLIVTQLTPVVGRDNIVEGSRYIWFGILLSGGGVI